MNSKFVKFHFFVLLILGLAMISCIPQAKMKYLQDKEGDTVRSEFKILKPDYRIKPGDYLYTRVVSLDQKSNEVFATISGSAAGNYNMNITDQNLYLTSYMVSDSGYINFPLIGKIYAKDQTIDELQQTLTRAVSEIITDPRLREVHLGEAEGTNRHDLEKIFGKEILRAWFSTEPDDMKHRFPGGESRAEALVRITDCLTEILRTHFTDQ